MFGYIALFSLAIASSAEAKRVQTPACRDLSTTVEAIAETLERRYVLSREGAEAAARLRDRIGAGRFSHICGDDRQAARYLSQEVSYVLPDKHLRIAAGPPAPKEVPAEPSPEALEDNLGIKEISRLPGGIAYLRISGWAPVSWVEPRLAKAVDLLRGSSGVIIDVRGNPGGDGDTMNLLLRSFLPRNAPASQNGFDRDGRPVEWVSKLPSWTPLPASTPVAVLIDGDSASASESLAFALQEEKRATIFGRRSAGAGHGVRDAVALPGGFSVYVPEYRVAGRISGSTWEGVGVEPDIRTGPGEAKDVAWEYLRNSRSQAN